MLRGKPGLRNVSFSVFILCRCVCGATLVHVLREFDELPVAPDRGHGGLLGFSLFDPVCYRGLQAFSEVFEEDALDFFVFEMLICTI